MIKLSRLGTTDNNFPKLPCLVDNRPFVHFLFTGLSDGFRRLLMALAAIFTPLPGVRNLVKEQACGQKKDKYWLVHSPSGLSKVVVCCPHDEPRYDPQACTRAKSLMDQDKIALFTEKVVLYYND